MWSYGHGCLYHGGYMSASLVVNTLYTYGGVLGLTEPDKMIR